MVVAVALRDLLGHKCLERGDCKCEHVLTPPSAAADCVKVVRLINHNAHSQTRTRAHVCGEIRPEDEDTAEARLTTMV